MTIMKTKPLPKKPSCEQFIDMFPQPFVVIDQDYNILASNKAYQRHYNVSPDELLGRHCYEVSHHSEVPCSQHGEHCPLEEVFTTSKPTQVMHIHYKKDGKEEYVQLQAMPILSDDGEVLYMGESFQTINQAKNKDNILVGRSPAFLQMSSLLLRVAQSRSTVLLLGESGVGKESAAKYIHHYSEHREAPFKVVDCSSLDAGLIEIELFGYEKGAFGSASKPKQGIIEAANGGTLYLSEISNLPLPLQTKLLRVIESGMLRRLGDNKDIKVDVRVIAATTHNLQTLVTEGRFRQDLYYRLSAFPIRVPPLRERIDDVGVLAEHILGRLPEGERHIPLSSNVIAKLMSYDYSGNITELQNILERAVILACDDILRPEHIVKESIKKPGSAAGPETPEEKEISEDILLTRRNRLTKRNVMEALQKTFGHRSQAAKLLGISERTLYRYIQRMR